LIEDKTENVEIVGNVFENIEEYKEILVKNINYSHLTGLIDCLSHSYYADKEIIELSLLNTKEYKHYRLVYNGFEYNIMYKIEEIKNF
jgi:hypothetical protein